MVSESVAHTAVNHIRGNCGPLRASSRFLMVSSSVATSGSLGDVTLFAVLSKPDLGGVGTALAPETA